MRSKAWIEPREVPVRLQCPHSSPLLTASSRSWPRLGGAGRVSCPLRGSSPRPDNQLERIGGVRPEAPYDGEQKLGVHRPLNADRTKYYQWVIGAFSLFFGMRARSRARPSCIIGG